MRRNIVLSIALMLMLQGCGHKGPLILPAPKAQSSKTSAPDLQQSNISIQPQAK